MELENGKRLFIRDYWLAKFPAKMCGLEDGTLPLDTIFEIINSLKHHPPRQYRINFAKFVIKKLESGGVICDDDESLDKWYGLLESLTSAAKATDEAERFYRLYDVDDKSECPIRIFEDEKAFVSGGSTGFITWTAALELAKWLDSDRIFGQSSSDSSWVFELGCGTGLLSVAIMRKFPQKLKMYWATDAHAGVLARCQENLEANQLTDKVVTLQLDWVTDEALFLQHFQRAAQTCGTPGILLGADVFFDAKMAPSLAKIIHGFTKTDTENPVRIYFSSEVRNDETFAEFKRQIESFNLDFRVVHSWNGASAVSSGVIVEMSKNSWK